VHHALNHALGNKEDCSVEFKVTVVVNFRVLKKGLWQEDASGIYLQSAIPVVRVEAGQKSFTLVTIIDVCCYASHSAIRTQISHRSLGFVFSATYKDDHPPSFEDNSSHSLANPACPSDDNQFPPTKLVFHHVRPSV